MSSPIVDTLNRPSLWGPRTARIKNGASEPSSSGTSPRSSAACRASNATQPVAVSNWIASPSLSVRTCLTLLPDSSTHSGLSGGMPFDIQLLALDEGPLGALLEQPPGETGSTHVTMATAAQTHRRCMILPFLSCLTPPRRLLCAEKRGGVAVLPLLNGGEVIRARCDDGRKLYQVTSLLFEQYTVAPVRHVQVEPQGSADEQAKPRDVRPRATVLH